LPSLSSGKAFLSYLGLNSHSHHSLLYGFRDSRIHGGSSGGPSRVEGLALKCRFGSLRFVIGQ
jgi:hypothetical protein